MHVGIKLVSRMPYHNPKYQIKYFDNQDSTVSVVNPVKKHFHAWNPLKHGSIILRTPCYKDTNLVLTPIALGTFLHLKCIVFVLRSKNTLGRRKIRIHITFIGLTPELKWAECWKRTMNFLWLVGVQKPIWQWNILVDNAPRSDINCN